MLSVIVLFAHSFRLNREESSFTPLFYALLMLGFMLHSATGVYQMLIMVQFVQRITDDRIKYIYRSLLITLLQLGTMISTAIVLIGISLFSSTRCQVLSSGRRVCESSMRSDDCVSIAYGDSSACVPIKDGFLIEIILSIIIGVYWQTAYRDQMKQLAKISYKQWIPPALYTDY